MTYNLIHVIFLVQMEFLQQWLGEWLYRNSVGFFELLKKNPRPSVNTRKQSTNFGEARYCEVYNDRYDVHYMKLKWVYIFTRKKAYSPSNYKSYKIEANEDPKIWRLNFIDII
jgi:hypothetical protein